MLQILIPETVLWDDFKEEFITIKEQTLQLEHSLLSLAKWESKWHKPFLSKEPKTPEETIDYIKCMTLTQNVKPEVYLALTRQHMDEINAYIDNPMTATTFSEDKRSGKGNKEVITAEIIYYWMIAQQVPPQYEKWHLNRLITLIRVCGIKNEPPKKMSRRDTLSRNAKLNAARKKQLNTTG
jgi:hypothetical protein